MNSRVIQRLQQLENRRTELGGPVDGLSASLWEFGQHLASLDELGLMAEAAELGIDPEDVQQMRRDYSPPIWRRGKL